MTTNRLNTRCLASLCEAAAEAAAGRRPWTEELQSEVDALTEGERRLIEWFVLGAGYESRRSGSQEPVMPDCWHRAAEENRNPWPEIFGAVGLLAGLAVILFAFMTGGVVR